MTQNLHVHMYCASGTQVSCQREKPGGPMREWQVQGAEAEFAVQAHSDGCRQAPGASLMHKLWRRGSVSSSTAWSRLLVEQLLTLSGLGLQCKMTCKFFPADPPVGLLEVDRLVDSTGYSRAKVETATGVKHCGRPSWPHDLSSMFPCAEAS